MRQLKKVGGNSVPFGYRLTRAEIDLLELPPSALSKADAVERRKIQARLSYERLKQGIHIKPRKGKPGQPVTVAKEQVAPKANDKKPAVKKKPFNIFNLFCKKEKEIFKQVTKIDVKPETITTLEANKLDNSFLLVSGSKKIIIKQTSYKDVVAALELAGFTNYKIMRVLTVES